jgi:hypothetical protein
LYEAWEAIEFAAQKLNLSRLKLTGAVPVGAKPFQATRQKLAGKIRRM